MDDLQQKKLLSAIDEIVGGLRADVAKLNERCDSIADSIKKDAKKKADSAGERTGENEDDLGATRTAADSVLSDQIKVLQHQVNDLVVKSPRPLTQADRDAFADVQAKCDAVLRVHNDRAEPDMRGESLMAYKLRLHRPMQRHSKKWAKAELAVIAQDQAVLDRVLDEIRADAYEAGVRPVDLPIFQHREIKTESPGGHRITTFHGIGTIFKQLGRPARYVVGIGGDDRRPRSGGGKAYVQGGQVPVKYAN